MNEHAGIARAVMGVVPTSEKAMAAADSLVGILITGGLHPQVAAWRSTSCRSDVSAVSFEESIQERAGDGRPLEKQEADFVEQLHAFFSSLPPEQFPNLTANADVLTTGSGDDRFEFGMAGARRGPRGGVELVAGGKAVLTCRICARRPDAGRSGNESSRPSLHT